MNISNIFGVPMENRILKSLMLSRTVRRRISKASWTVFLGSAQGSLTTDGSIVQNANCVSNPDLRIENF